MQNSNWREQTIALRGKMLWGTTLGTAAVVWGMLVAHAVFGVNFIAPRPGDAPGSDWMMYLWIAIGVTLFSILATLFMIQRVTALYRDGVEVSGKVTKIHTFMGQPLARISYTYSVEGKEFTKAGPMDKALAEKLEREGGLVVLVDPRRPGRHVLRLH